MDTLVNLLSLLGALALFLYGMKIMSEGLEKFAGNKLRAILAAMTRNRLMGVLTGVLVTALIQSSSATTVMVVSFVNAGLMNLIQAIGVIMGANIGTTVTAWIISAVGFKVNIAAFAIPMLALGMPLIFSSKSNRKSVGEFVFGFSFLFMGLSFLQAAANDLNIGSMVASMLASISSDSFWIILLFVLVGAVVTMIVQASAATMAITLMLFDMQIPGFGFEQAAALAMGQNIGTTITAFMASLTANTQARRAALAHMFFNVFGVVVVLLMFYPACHAVSWFVTDVLGSTGNDLFKLSAFHTAFNIFNTLLLIGFVRQIEQLVCWVLPMSEEQNEEHHLRFISAGLLSTAELSILEAQKEVRHMAEVCQRMLGMVRELLEIHALEGTGRSDSSARESEFVKVFSRIERYESITDRMEVEIADYLHNVSEGRLSAASKAQIQKMLTQISELESVGDSCYNLGRTLNRKLKHQAEPYTPEQHQHLLDMLSLNDQAMAEMISIVSQSEDTSVNLMKAQTLESEINNFRKQVKGQNFNDVDTGIYNYQLGVYYMDFISECEKLGDYLMNVDQAGLSKNNDHDDKPMRR